MRTSTTRRIALAGLLAASLTLPACGSDSGDSGEGPIRIGVMNPFSGDFALYGREVFRGYELAAEEANANGGVLGRQVELLRGDALSADDAIAEAERLAGQQEVDIFAGSYVSAVSDAASDVASQYEKVYWDTNALALDLTERELPNYIRVGPDAGDLAEGGVDVIVEAMPDLLGKPAEEITVWLEHEDSIYGTSVAERQEDLLEEAGVTVAGVGAHSAGAADVTDSILRARDAAPDVWLQTGYVPDTNLLLETARDQGFSPPVVMTAGTGDTFETLDAVGEQGLEGTLVVSYPRAEISEEYGPGSDAFLDAYVEAHGEEPIAPQTLTAYTGVQVMFDAIEEAGELDVDSIREAAADMDVPLNQLPNGFGVEFNDEMDNERTPFAVIQWQSGEQVTVFPEKAAAGDFVNITETKASGADQ